MAISTNCPTSDDSTGASVAAPLSGATASCGLDALCSDAPLSDAHPSSEHAIRTLRLMAATRTERKELLARGEERIRTHDSKRAGRPLRAGLLRIEAARCERFSVCVQPTPYFGRLGTDSDATGYYASMLGHCSKHRTEGKTIAAIRGIRRLTTRAAIHPSKQRAHAGSPRASRAASAGARAPELGRERHGPDHPPAHANGWRRFARLRVRSGR